MTAIEFTTFGVYLITVTPAIAAEWLATRNAINRYCRPSVVDQYSRDVTASKWLMTGETISFDWNGQLINGQHRLRAVTKTGKSMQVLIVTGLDPAVRTVIDTQSRRSVRDAFMNSGKTQMIGEGGSVSGNTAAGMWSRMKYGIRQSKGMETRQELLAFAEMYPEGGLFALEVFGKIPRAAKVSTSPVMAAVARAYYHYEETELPRLERFVTVLVTGKSVNEMEASIHTLRHFLTGLREDGSPSKANVSRNSNAQYEIYGKTCRAIQAFMGHEMLGRLYLPQVDPFPLPERGAPVDGPDRVPTDSRQLIAGRSGAVVVAERLPLGRVQ